MKKYSKLAITSLALTGLGAFMTLLSGYGYQWNWWGLGTAFRILIPGGALVAVTGIMLGFANLYFRRRSQDAMKVGWMTSVAGVLGIAVLVNFGYWYIQVEKGYPPIHDITTDTNNPPQFEEIVSLRADAPNKTEYGGEEVARQQHEFYGDIITLYLSTAPSDAFEKALESARNTFWEIVSADRVKLKIEAFHKLPWFGFIDDIVIRVDTTEEGSKIDVRSVSRVGRGDLGVNADRIKDYLDSID